MFRLASSILPERALQSLTGAYFKVHHRLTVGAGNFHSKQSTINTATMKIQVCPALSDNYMYLIIDEQSGEAAIVDPVNPDTVIEAVKEAQVNLTTVITTHHHWDHASGNADLVKKWPTSLKVYGGDERIAALTDVVKHGSTFTVGNLTFNCLATPCHTTGHICYYVTSSLPEHKPAVFTGDTLFLSGCGKFFEGTAEQMYEALITKLSSLPDETNVYCGHEYAISNLLYASHVDPDNTAVAQKLSWVRGRRDNGLPSVPSTIGEEKQYNPFMRVENSVLKTRYKTSTGVETMKALRLEKDSWRPPA